MDLYLFRHGNTFQVGEKPVWVGSRNDMPLVEKGIQQAQAAGAWLAVNDIKPHAVYCGPLRRTRTFSEIIIEWTKAACPAVIDPRLNELDYGEWSGLSDDDVRRLFGDRAFEEWKLEGKWPDAGHWGQSASFVFDECLSFLRDMAATHVKDGSVVAVTSNGRLKYFAKVLSENFGAPVPDDASVKTGHVCKIAFDSASVSVVYS